MLSNVIAVGIGGMLGSVCRYLAGRAISQYTTTYWFPWGTFAVNLAGSFVLGVVAGIALRKGMTATPLMLFLGTGFCGGFTTFSAFSLENFTLLQQHPLQAVAYATLSIAGGLGGVALGLGLAKLY